jgi:rhodanese-related sulfurtransferase
VSIATITPRELDELSKRQAVDLIDVRTPAEFREMHIDFARLAPLESLDPKRVIAGRRTAADEPLYVVCRSGSRARRACELMLGNGFGNVVVVEGGTLGWEKAGLPVVRGKNAISLERQVRIAAGSLVLVGCILGATVHPAFIALAGFVGAGLIFAGVTDRCGMALLLARMPWNQVAAADQPQPETPATC